MQATLTTKGQLTLPASIRKQLHLKPGDKIEFFTKLDGHIEGIPIKKSVKALKGILPKPTKPVSLSDMDKAIADGAIDARD